MTNALAKLGSASLLIGLEPAREILQDLDLLNAKQILVRPVHWPFHFLFR